MSGRVFLEHWWLGASRVAHQMVDRGDTLPVQFRSRCGLFQASVPRPAADGVPRCQRCVRGLAADERHTVAHGAAAGPSRLEVVVPFTEPRQVFAGSALPMWTIS